MTITCGKQTLLIPDGTTAEECLRALSAYPPGTVAALVNGAVAELNASVRSDATLTPLTPSDEEGRRVYERSLRFVLLLALRSLYPGRQVRIEYSAGPGVFIRLPGIDMDETMVAAVEAEMRRITLADMPFVMQRWQKEDAIAYFEQDGQTDKVELLRRRPFDYFNMYCCDGMWEYFYGAMAPSTGYVSTFRLHPHAPGFVMLLPAYDDPSVPASYVHRPKHLAVFSQSARWCEILGVVNAADLANMMERRRMRAFIRVNEALHDQAIGDIARQIAARGKRIILVAGPSSSGKTTFAGRLGVHLTVLGRRPVQISLDNYYRNRCDLPLEPDGTVDLEALHTIDVALLQEHLRRLLDGEEVEIPRFDFCTAMRKPRGVPLKLEPGQPVIIEGIHGLNPALSDHLPQAVIHRVFVSALTCINLDDHNRIRTTDVRLLRRIVRDHQFRGTTPENTMKMWPSVRRGEEKWIFPYQELADSVFNTALHYELPVLKRFAFALLQQIQPGTPEDVLSQRLRKVLHYFPEISDDMLDEIPPLSLLREFIGGSTMEKE
ncbi:MAG: nucleoside kinase [Clostridia bacterium]|nr:nucleoside kinase [Clostridia bacterium]